ncbi:MAG: hypothetical protein A4E67_00817 [Syntrophaceae bacterium PtaB.Bin038]|nr:MAG: hypothetical protein A4E67_00817 [Syntrophaceae bacterium PtaB.Bin038]
MDDLKATGRPASSGGGLRKRRVRVHRSGLTLKRFLVILAAAILTSLLVVALGSVFDIPEDNTYRPKDIERRYYEMQRMKDAVDRQQTSSSGR